MIIDATPASSGASGASWWAARSSKLSMTCRFEPIGSAPAAPSARNSMERGLALFHAGKVAQALPSIGQAAVAGDSRARYLFATALFNGDGVARDWPTAWRLMLLAQQGGIVQAAESLARMAELIPPADREAEDIPPLLEEPLLSTATSTAVATMLATLADVTPAPTRGSLDDLMRELLAPMLKLRLDRVLPERIAEQLAAVAEQSSLEPSRQ